MCIIVVVALLPERYEVVWGVDVCGLLPELTPARCRWHDMC